MPHYQSLKPTIRLTFLNLLTGTRFSQCNIITIEDQIIHLSDVIVLKFRDLVLCKGNQLSEETCTVLIRISSASIRKGE